MEYVDTHCHIQTAGTTTGERSTRELWAKYPELYAAQLVETAVASGVSRLVCVGCDLPDSELAVSFAQTNDHVWASIGIHPHEAARYVNDNEAWNSFRLLAASPRVVAIGECGLDYYYEHSPKEQQMIMLHRQLQLAQDQNLPVIFHVREAFDDFWPILAEFPKTRGVLHSYTDSADNLALALSRGLFIGVNGIATFAKLPAQQAMYKAIPLTNLLLETDAPFLTPTPYRGTVNEPKHIVTVAEFLAQLNNTPLSELATATTTNAINLFGLK